METVGQASEATKEAVGVAEKPRAVQVCASPVQRRTDNSPLLRSLLWVTATKHICSTTNAAPVAAAAVLQGAALAALGAAQLVGLCLLAQGPPLLLVPLHTMLCMPRRCLTGAVPPGSSAGAHA